MFKNLTLSRFGWNRKRRPRRAASATGGRGFLKRRSMRLESLEDRRLLSVEPVSNIFGGSTGDGPSFLDTASEQATSRDGRFVVFTSEATDFVAPGQDLNGAATDVFLYDRFDQSVILISRADGTSQTANGASFSPMISDDGVFVAFLSAATDLVAGQTDANGGADLFRYDVAADAMQLISHADGQPTTAGDGAVGSAAINLDGSVIAFDSLATNLVPLQDDLNGSSDVFLWIDDGLTPEGTTQLVSRAADGGTTGTGNAESHDPFIDGGGGLVLYTSQATDLVPAQDDTNAGTDVFLFDDRFQTTILVSGSLGSQTTTADGPSQAEGMDFFGTFAVITSDATDLATIFDPVTELLSPAGVIDNNGARDVFLFDADTLAITLVSHVAGDPLQTPGAQSTNPAISADGRFVAFESDAPDIAAGVTDTAGFEDVFLFDRVSGANQLVSHAFGQPLVPANGDSTAPELNADGRFVAFESLATDLAGITDPVTLIVTLMVDTNGASDIFVLDRGAGVMHLASHVEPLDPADPPTTGDGASTHPVISANGLSVAFNSDAEDLFFGDFNFVSDVFLFSTAAFGTNSAPVLDPAVSPLLDPILEGTVADVDLGTPVGTAVDEILATPGLYSDADGTASKGLAIVGQDETNGFWEFTTDGGASWDPFGITSDSFAILLSADGAGQNRIRFLPIGPQFFGTATFSFRGWDLTDGNLSGSIDMDVSINGGNTAFSAETAIGVATVSPVNDQPFFTKGVDQTVLEDSGPVASLNWATGISAGVPNESGQVLTFVLTPDNPALFANGPEIDPLTGTLLFTPAPNANGVATIDVQLMDDGGTADGGVDTSITQTLVITITPVNDAPVAQPMADLTLPVGGAPAVIDLAAAFADVDIATNGDQLTFTAVSDNPAAVAVSVAGTQLTVQPLGIGAAIVTVTATDLAGATAQADLTVLVGIEHVVQLPRTVGGNAVVVSRVGPNLRVMNRTRVLLNAPLDQAVGLMIVGAANRSDRVTVDLGAGGGLALAGGIVFDGGAGRGLDILTVRGTSGDDTFTLGAQAVTFTSATANIEIPFTGVERLRLDGRAGNDTYVVPSLPLPTTILDARGIDTLDFSGAATGVNVNLGSAVAQRVFGGPPSLKLQSAVTIENVIGTAFNDVLRGGARSSLLVGGDGDDILVAGRGRSVLIGGLGVDNLRGRALSDLLIGGSTTFDADQAALLAILAEWTARLSIDARVTNLTDGIGPALTPGVSVLDDGAADTLFGGLGGDWFLSFASDNVLDQGPADRPV